MRKSYAPLGDLTILTGKNLIYGFRDSVPVLKMYRCY